MNNLNHLNETDKNLNKYALLVEYDGENFYGSQIQKNLRTVHEVLQSTMSILLKEDPNLTFSGRTDTGVSALGQVVHFVTYNEIQENKFIYSLNSLLPKDISVRAMQKVSSEFHARKSACKRWYRYQIYNHQQKSAVFRKCLHVHYTLDEKLMNEALQSIIGYNTFESFKSANSNNPYSDCYVYAAAVGRENSLLSIDIVANRFLYNMVRIIVGTLLLIGQGKKPVCHLSQTLKAKDRTQAGKTVNPEGLTLMSIEYPEELKVFQKEAININKNVTINLTEATYEDLYRKAS